MAPKKNKQARVQETAGKRPRTGDDEGHEAEQPEQDGEGGGDKVSDKKASDGARLTFS